MLPCRADKGTSKTDGAATPVSRDPTTKVASAKRRLKGKDAEIPRVQCCRRDKRLLLRSKNSTQTHSALWAAMAPADKRSLRVLLALMVVLPMSYMGDGRKLKSSTCESIECPSYDVLYETDDFSVREYNGTVWMATSSIQDTSFYNATRTGFRELFAYIQGANEEGVEVNMTAPVLTGIIPSDGPFCMSTFIVRFYVPAAYHESPPTPLSSLNLQVDRWDVKYVAVRQFDGFATDTNVVEEGVTLAASVYEAGFDAISTSSDEESYFVAQYNSPFQITGRLNEILLPISYSSLLRRKSS